MTWVLVVFFANSWNSASVTNIPGYTSADACFTAEKALIEFADKDAVFQTVKAYCITGPTTLR